MPELDKHIIGENLKNYRRARGLTHEDLAAQLDAAHDMQVSLYMLKKYEQGTDLPASILWGMAAVLNVNVQDFFAPPNRQATL